jgi:hypothetical protein
MEDCCSWVCTKTPLIMSSGRSVRHKEVNNQKTGPPQHARDSQLK